MAAAAGFPRVLYFTDADEYAVALADILHAPGPTLVSVDVEAGDEGPISRGPRQEARYLQVSLADWSRQMRRTLIGNDMIEANP